MEENMQALMDRLNSSSQFLQSNDMRVTEVRHGFAKVEMIIDEQILNIHGFVHGVFDVFVVRSQGEEIVVEHLHMGLGFHIESLLHGASLDKDGHIAIQHIYFLMGIGHHYLGCPNAGDTDDDTAHKEQ